MHKGTDVGYRARALADAKSVPMPNSPPSYVESELSHFNVTRTGTK